MSERGPKIAVCIPTFRRPRQLARLLEALAQIDTKASLRVIVADNDGKSHQGFDLCRDLTGYRWPLDGLIVRERGVVEVRNVLTAAALETEAEFIAMIDDDEWPAPNWLDAFVAVQGATGAEALGGSIRFDTEFPAGWTAGFDGVSSIEHATGPIAMLEGAGNIFLSRTILDRMTPPWFDAEFGLSGGEDRDFFERLKREGCRFAWAAEALAFTRVPETRSTLGWVMRRAFRIGNAEMRIFRKYPQSAGARIKEGAKIAFALLSLPLVSVILAPFPNRAADALRRWFRNAGKLAALAGRRHDEYAVIQDDGD
jgi:succinoglycan biosynthesis protein ExoM